MTSAVTLIAFSAMALHPPPALAALPALPAPHVHAEKPDAVATSSAQLQDALVALEEALKAAVPDAWPKPAFASAAAGGFGKPVASSPTDAQALRSAATNVIAKANAVEALIEPVVADLRSEGEHLSARQLSDLRSFRHDQMMRDFNARVAKFGLLVAAVKNAADTGALRPALADLANFMARYPNRKPHHYTDPNKLPFGTPGKKARRPYDTEKALRSQLAATSPIPAAQALPAPTAADLAQTEDVQITQAIRDKAAELGKNPVNIYNWVRNNIEFLPTYGSIQGSDATLASKRGNGFDTASLLIALYRASGIAARYVYGTVEISADRVMNWVGGVQAPEAAQSLLGQGGVPNTALVAGGRIARFQIEHVWVEAFLNYYPSRGAVTGAPDTWVPMDASFKQYAISAPGSIQAVLGIDLGAEGARITASASNDPSAPSLTGLDAGAMRALLDRVTVGLPTTSEWLAAADPLAAFGTGDKRIVAETFSEIPATLPYQLKATGGRFSELPASLRHSIEIQAFSSALDQASDSPSLTERVSLPRVAGHRLGVTYVGAGAADEAILAGIRTAPNFSGIPLYSISLVPELRLETDVLARGEATQMGAINLWTVHLVGPTFGADEGHSFEVSAGDELVFGIDAAGISIDAVQGRLRAVPSDTAAENLQTVAMAFWAQADLLDQAYAHNRGARVYRAPSVGLFAAPLVVEYAFGIPRNGYYGARTMDVSNSVSAIAKVDGSNAADVVSAIGLVTSFLEGATFDGVFNREIGTGVSAVQLLADANNQRIPIYAVDRSNAAALMPRLVVDQDVQQEIAAAVAAGKTVIVPARAPVHGTWHGLGYIIQDPDSGLGAYLIKGGRNGGGDDPCDAEKKREPVRVPITAIVVIVVLALLLAILLIWGPAIALVLAGIGKELAELGAVLGLALAGGAFAAQAPPGNGLAVPGDCTFAQHLLLQAAVDLYCHGTPSCRSFPTSGANCGQIAEVADTWQQCIGARQAVNATCFRGGNTGHQIALADSVKALVTCQCRLGANGC